MKILLSLAAIASLTACSSDVIELKHIEMEGTSSEVEHLRVFFEVPEGIECAGVRVRDVVHEDSVERFLTFVRAGDDPRVDLQATLSDSYGWEGKLMVELDLAPEFYPGGGVLELRTEDRFSSVDQGTYTFPKRD